MISISCHVSWAPLDCDFFLHLPCFLLSWQFWGHFDRYFVGNLSTGIFLIVFFFFWLDRSYRLVKEDHRSKVSFSLQNIKGTYYSIWCMVVDVDLDHPFEIAFSRSLHYKVFLFFPLSTLYSLKGIHYPYTQWMGSYGSLHLGQDIDIIYCYFLPP